MAGASSRGAERTALLVLGMHRSGTSALAGALSLAGVELGQRLVAPKEDNPKGFFEHDQVWRTHQDLLVALGASWHDVRPLPPGWEQSAAAQEARERLRRELTTDFSGARLWGVKDPRLSRCFALWPELVETLGAEARVILALRDPFEVAASLQKRDKLRPAHALALWLRYTLDAERETRGVRRAVQFYPDLLADWRRELQRLGAALGLPLREAAQEAQIDAFLDRGLRHHAQANVELGAAQPYTQWCEAAFAAMRALEAQPETAMRTLDEIRQAFDRSLDAAQGEQIADHVRQIGEQEKAIAFFAEERARLIDWGRREEGLRISREGELDILRTALAQTQAELSHVYGSRSWRLTRPLREAMALLKRFKRGPRAAEPAPERVLTATSPSEAEVQRGSAASIGQGADNGVNASRAERRGLGSAPQSASTGGALRLLIVTPDLHGPIRNGGIGTAFAAMAQMAAARGAQVTVLYALGRHSEDGPIENWVARYARQGVRLVPLDGEAAGQTPIVDAPIFRRNAWHVHAWLQQHQDEFDVAVFPEWMGLAFYVLLARGQGLAYSSLSVIVNAHSPQAWAVEGNRQLPQWPDDVDRDFMERESARRADWLISPSAYLLDWMRAHRWQFPARVEVVPNVTPEAVRGHVAHADRQTALHRLVFFGRLEPRKGLKLFCDAIDRLPQEVRHKISRVTFLGKAIVSGGFDSREFIAQRSRGWGLPVDVLTDRNRDGALAELERPGTLAVIPSLTENSPYTVLECLARGVAFIASAVGGIPEMLEKGERETHLFAPNPQALAQRISQAFAHGLRPAALAWDSAAVEERWWSLLDQARRERSARARCVTAQGAPEPLVSVCLVHYNRPHLLAQALDSLRAQSYRNFEVVLVDDGSPSEEARRYLNAIEPEFAARGWKIIRQDNSYLGAARNAAARAARGDYLLFMDDDNVARPEMLATFVTAARHSGADVLTCVNMPFAEDSPPSRPERIWLPLGGAAGAGLYRNAFGDANALWKKQAFEKLGGYTTDYGVGHEDWELFADAALSGLRLELIPQPLYWYRVNPAGMLRAGDHWADHARSVRPYLRHDPQGLGMALAYGLYLQRLREVGALTAVAERLPVSRGRAFWRAVRMGVDPSMRAQFIGAVRGQGWRVAIRRALNKAAR